MAARYTLYHHPTCSKSINALTHLQTRLQPTSFNAVIYTTTPPTAQTLKEVFALLPKTQLPTAVRPDECSEAERAQVQNGSVDDVVDVVMVDIVKRLQRPILVDWIAGKAAVGRPMDQILELLEENKE
ncbi:uncharacterized protein SPPG_07035 [Spizellomyces punctatus DAOM BR117]|uniref:Glutaredoxin domain-containing protein n=1 Tax=Spizellomyces punctatus (strain DAOM BR117) TaxID=645134 RepID=A0A0L0H8R2_SPIPD|nr:uncharacterized protein SPPG_07035 [Spizellomyces punctatus DAOM BR117]KNC97562.1 hypothetical protein SPPG_07035 [Spizellomyces punctatus DAOM BR117]|eukprot:XP_016605602.1 hypothetical protein SPPG_07035 [Spizellomyces punctatus DAOM BR117]